MKQQRRKRCGKKHSHYNRYGLRVLLGAAVAVVFLWPSGARSGGQSPARLGALGNVLQLGQAEFSAKERARLIGGRSVKRRFMIQRGDVDYHAGLAYRLVRASPLEVIRALRRPDGIVRAIPYGLEAKAVNESDGFTEMRILQGKRPVVGAYTVQVAWDLKRHEARFWLDPAHEHDVRDIWGVFRARPVKPGWTLVSFGFAFDIGGIGGLLERQAQTWGLSTADRIARLLE